MRLLITLLFLVYFSGGFSQSVDIDNPVRFLALGDSYTIGQSVPVADRWPEQFAEELRKKDYDVAALKIIAQTGWRTDNLIYAIETERPLIGYNLVSLLIGVNNQYQGASINTYEDEFEELLKTAISLAGDNKESVFVLSIPDYGYTPFGESNQLSISTEINAFNNVNKRITDWYGVAYFDITSISRQGLINTSLVASDGLHPSGEMYARWVELIARNIKRNQGLSTSTVARGTEMN
jgi:lysophospholipase L1-like esterase